MVTAATTAPSLLDAKMSKAPGRIGMLVFGVALVVGVIYAGAHLISDLSVVRTTSIFPFLFCFSAWP